MDSLSNETIGDALGRPDDNNPPPPDATPKKKKTVTLGPDHGDLHSSPPDEACETLNDNNTNNDNNTAYSPAYTHVKTYTAGEDAGRLQQAAMDLGLAAAAARQPRRPVRGRRLYHHHHHHGKHFYLAHPQQIVHLLLHSATEDARMRAILTSHHDGYYDNGDNNSNNALWLQRRASLPEWLLKTMIDEENDGALDPHGEGIGGDLVSAVLGIVKGMVGPAILYLPHGFASAGYFVAIPVMIVCTFMFLYSSTCLLQSWKAEQDRESATDETTDEATGLMGENTRPVMLSYPELAYRALGPPGETLVKAGIALMQSGVCLTYLIFVPQNLHTSFLQLSGLDVAPAYWLLVMVGLQIPLSWIRDIRKLTPTNLLANSLILYGLITCLGFAIQQALSQDSSVGPVVAIERHFEALSPFRSSWFLFIGTSVLLFEGSITLLVPLQEAVDTEEQRAQFPAVYQITILCIICFYAFFGITCWMAFGQEVHTVLTTSLPNGALATTVQLAYSIAVIFTFPLQNFPALEIACRTISTRLARARVAKPLTQRNVISSILVILLAVVAVSTMESLDKVVSLMGSLLGCPIAFVFPPLIHSQLTKDSITPTRLWGNRLVAAFGGLAMACASIVTLVTWK